MKIIKQTHNPVLGRYQVELEHEHFKQATPKESDVLKEVAGVMKASPENVKVKHIYSGYGGGKSRIIAYVYENADALKNIEIFNKKAKKKEEKKPAEK